MVIFESPPLNPGPLAPSLLQFITDLVFIYIRRVRVVDERGSETRSSQSIESVSRSIDRDATRKTSIFEPIDRARRRLICTMEGEEGRWRPWRGLEEQATATSDSTFD
jgi:hypothetical protein